MHVYHKNFSAASAGIVSDLRMEGVSQLCDVFEQLQDPDLSMAIEVVEIYEERGAMVFGGENHPLASQGHPRWVEQLL